MIAETYLTPNILKNTQLTKTLKPASFRFFLNKLTKALFIALALNLRLLNDALKRQPDITKQKK